MWREYMGFTFKIPKFTDLHYIPEEKFTKSITRKGTMEARKMAMIS